MKNPIKRLLLGRNGLGALMLIGAVLSFPAAPANAVERQALRGHVPAAVARLAATGRLPASQSLNLALGLPLRNQEGLTDLLHQLYDPASTNYHRYLTPDQFKDMFGPTEESYQAVVRFAEANGLEVVTTHPNRVLLNVRGRVSDIEKAFQITLRTYQHPSEAREFYAPDVEPSRDSGVPILDITGLDNYSLPQHAMHRVPASEGRNLALGSGPGGSLLGYDFRNAYVPGSTLVGSGQIVGLLEFDGYFPSDILAYESLAGLPNVPLQNIMLDGFNGVPVNPGAVGEVSLDIEMAIAMAPGLSSVTVFEAGPNGFFNDILASMVTHPEIKQFSSSWGDGGGPDATMNTLFQQMAAQGQSFFQASGDGDAYIMPIWRPGDNPYVTSVGGTTLTMNGSGSSYASERVWNSGYMPPGWSYTTNGFWGSGGGVSTYYSIPFWQLGVNMTLNGGSTTNRNIPDVALTADNIWVVSDLGQQGAFMGTSAAAPLWAAFTALVNEQGAASGRPSVGFLNPTLYSLGGGPGYTSFFHDITRGDNTWSNSPNQFFAVAGYDLATGWGTPAGTNLINFLAPPTPAAFLVEVGYLVFGGNGNGIVDVNECNDFNVILANFGGGTATTVRGTLSTTTPGVFIVQPSGVYPDVPAGGFATNVAPFKISTSPDFVCGTPIRLTLQAKCDQSTTTSRFRIPSGETGTNVFRFDNSTPASIPDVSETNSIVVVSNITTALSKVTVSLYITHTYDSDLLLQLISPDGTTNTLSASNGSFGQNYGQSCSPDSARTTFDDNASTPIGSGNAPFVGVFQPQTLLSVFNGKAGTNINGVWKLRVVDQFPQDTGTLQCWSLFLTPAACLDGGGQCPGADLAVGLIGQPEPDLVGNTLTYVVSVTNSGPSMVKNAQAVLLLPNGVAFVSAISSQGSCAQSGGVVTGNLGSMNPGTTATMTVLVTPVNTGTISATVNVTSEQADPDPSNNTATFISHITPPSTDLAAGISAVPNPAVLGGTITYTVSVTNNGPSTGSGIVVSNMLPPSIAIVSASVQQGSVSSDGSSWTVGNLPIAAGATATIVGIPTLAGTFPATTVVSGNQFDPVPVNNAATLNTIIGPSADLSVGIAEFPNPAVVLSNVTYVFSVSNAGPSAATSVSLSGSLPASINLLSTNASQGTVSISGTALTWYPGTLNRGAQATLTLVGQTTTNGTLVASATVAATEPDPNLPNNSATSSVRVAPAGVAVVAAGATLTAESFVPPNGAIDVGETVSVILRLRNASNSATLNLTGTLLATNGVVPVPPNNPQNYGVLAPSGFPVGRSFSFTANGTNGQTISAVLKLQDGTNVYAPVSFNFTLSSAQTFANTGAILLPDPAAPNPPYPLQSGPGKPYPSTITVSNLTGVLGKVTVTVSNLNHSYPGDINLLLVSPNGLSALLMSHAGDEPSTNADLTFDDTAPTPLPQFGQIYSQVWRPTAYSPGVQLGGFPGKPGPYQSALSVFNTSSPNGAWSLYAFDDHDGDAGIISNGWSLTLSTISPVNQLADLGLTAVPAPNPAQAGAPLTFTFAVANAGPAPSTSVSFTNILPTGLTLISAVSSQGNVFVNGNTILANLGNLSTGAVATVTVVTLPTPALLPPGVNSILLTNTASVWPAETDPNPANNVVAAVATVQRPVTGLQISQTGAPEPVFAGNALTNTIVVTNGGPGNALGVILTEPLPLGTILGSATTTVGTCSNVGGVVTAWFGDLSVNASATVTLILTNSLPGFTTNVATVTTTSQNTNAVRSAVYVATVLGPAAMIINAGAVLTHESGPINGIIDPGETVTVSFALANIGSLDTSNLKATLLPTGEVTSPGLPQYYGALIHLGPSVSRSFTFTAASVLTSPIIATLRLEDERSGVTNNLGTVTFTFALPASSAWANASSIVIPDHGVGRPYPSSIAVSGQIGSVIKATVTLNGFTHAFPHDVSALLVNPTGQSVLLMSHTGGGYAVTNVTLTFDDSASSSLPGNGPDLSGTYLPTRYPGAVVLPPPAPAGGYGPTLASLSGWNPNGTWSLFVFDDTAGDSGYITGGWSLNLQTAAPLVAFSDLAVSMTSTPDSLYLGNAMTNTIWVTNLGPATATGVLLTNSLSTGQQMVTNLGSLASGGTSTVTLLVAPDTTGTITTTVSVGSSQVDLNPANNTAQTTTLVTAPAQGVLSGIMINGEMHLTLTSQPGFVYAIQESTNLSSWASLVTNTVSAGGAIRYTDTNSPNFNQRFYRGLRLAP
jgi:uncharacterized repeat protein (TIGR01451 family)